MWYWDQFDTQDHTFPCKVVTPENVGQSGASCGKVTNEARQGTVWQTKVWIEEFQILRLLYSKPQLSTHFHTFFTLPHFATCHLCQNLFLVSHTLPHVQTVVMQHKALQFEIVSQIFINHTNFRTNNHIKFTILLHPDIGIHNLTQFFHCGIGTFATLFFFFFWKGRGVKEQIALNSACKK